MTGNYDSRFVEVEGVVHSVSQSDNNIRMSLALSDGMIGAVTLVAPGVDYARLVDARVVVQGNAAPIFTKHRHMVGARLLFESMSLVQVEEPAPADPFSMPVRPINACCASSRG